MQGFNMGRYRPPSTLDPALNPSTNDAPASKRARLSTWTTPAHPTVRFEMPFAIWCTTCAAHSSSALIGQGVRFNALKTKAGTYYSSPIWQFRMKHTACGGWIEMRTDPARSDFVVTEGARKRDVGDDGAVAERIGGVIVGGAEEEADRERRRNDAFAALEGKKEDGERVKGEAKRVEELRSLKERDWRDVDAANRKLRGSFRVGRKAREKDAEGVERLKDRMGLGIEFLDETEEDRRRARFVEFGEIGQGGDAASKPLFLTKVASKSKKSKPGGRTRLESLQAQLASNTRATMNPFTEREFGHKVDSITGVKKRKGHDPPSTCKVENQGNVDFQGTKHESIGTDRPAETSSGTGILVNYDSD